MFTSFQYLDLQDRVVELRQHLLPDPFSATSTYSDPGRVESQTRAFCLLVHAEIEAYIEARCSELLQAALIAWTQHCAVTRIGLSLVGFTQLAASPVPAALPPPPKTHLVATGPFREAVIDYEAQVERNNGIKTKNLLGLLVPIGVSIDALQAACPSLVADMESYGASRGKIAHSSGKGATTLLDPAIEFARGSKLVADLKHLDDALNELFQELAAVTNTYP